MLSGRNPKPLRRIERFLREHVEADGHTIKGNVSSEAFWRILGYEGRQEIVERAGWDSGGWIFKNWHELPHKLQLDIAYAWKDCMEKGILPDGTPLNVKK